MPDLFLPLRYGRVVLRERLPRRFYCRARWQTGGSDSETQVFDLDFVDRDGRELGGIREFTVKRAPREALLRGLGGDATRNMYTFGWQEVPPPASSNAAESGDGTWLIAGFDELAADLPGSVVVGPHCRIRRPGSGCSHRLRSAVPRSPASSGAAPGDPAQKSRAPNSARGWRARSTSCSQSCGRCRRSKT